MSKVPTQSQWQDLAGRVKTAQSTANSKGNGTITGISVNGTSVATAGVANIPAATTSAYGATKLTNSYDSTSTDTAATPEAVRRVYNFVNNKPNINITANDPGEGSTLAANNYVAVYGTSAGKITASDLANNSITNAKLATDAVTSNKISNSAVTLDKIDWSTIPYRMITEHTEIKVASSGYSDLSSMTVPAGTWLVIATSMFNCLGASVGDAYFRTFNKTSNNEIAAVWFNNSTTGGVYWQTHTVFGIVTLTSPSTITMQALRGSGTDMRVTTRRMCAIRIGSASS